MFEKLISSFKVDKIEYSVDHISNTDKLVTEKWGGFSESGKYSGYIWTSIEETVLSSDGEECRFGIAADMNTVGCGVLLRTWNRRLTTIGNPETLIERDLFGRISFCGIHENGVRNGLGTEFFYTENRSPEWLGGLWQNGTMTHIFTWKGLINIAAPDLSICGGIPEKLDRLADHAPPERGVELARTALTLARFFDRKASEKHVKKLRKKASAALSSRHTELDRVITKLSDRLKKLSGKSHSYGEAVETAELVLDALEYNNDDRKYSAADKLARIAESRMDAERWSGSDNQSEFCEICFRCAEVYQGHDAAKVRFFCDKIIKEEEKHTSPDYQNDIRINSGYLVFSARLMIARNSSTEYKPRNIARTADYGISYMRFIHDLRKNDNEEAMMEAFSELAGLFASVGNEQRAAEMREIVSSGELPPVVRAAKKTDLAPLIPLFKEKADFKDGKKVTTAGFFVDNHFSGFTFRHIYGLVYKDKFDRIYSYDDPAVFCDRRGIFTSSVSDELSRGNMHSYGDGVSVKLLERDGYNTVLFCGMHFRDVRHGLGAEFQYSSKGKVLSVTLGLWQDGELTHTYEDSRLVPLNG